MVLRTFIYYNKGKKKIKVKVCDTILGKFFGLMFRKKSPPLLFIFDKEKKLCIHSLFCKPFKAIWLNEKKQVTKIEEVYRWRFNISGFGKYLLEVPTRTTAK